MCPSLASKSVQYKEMASILQKLLLFWYEEMSRNVM